MKSSFINLLMLLVTATAQRPATLTYTLNPVSSRLTWTGYAEVGSYAPTGTLRLAPGGTVTLAGLITLRAARVLVDVRTLTHENEQLQTHLRSADFFDVAHYPTASFELLRVAGSQAQGRLTIKEHTQLVTVPIRIVPLGVDSLLLVGTARFDRTQFGIHYNSTSFFQHLGSYAIRNECQLTFALRAGRR